LIFFKNRIQIVDWGRSAKHLFNFFDSSSSSSSTPFLLQMSKEAAASKKKDRQLMPPPLPKLSSSTHTPTKPGFAGTATASMTLLSLNPPLKPIVPKKVSHYQIQVKQMMMENIRMYTQEFVDPPTPLGSLELIRKLLVVAKEF